MKAALKYTLDSSLNLYSPFTKNLAAAVSGAPLMFPASGFLFKNSCTKAKSAPKSAASPAASTVPGLFDKLVLEKSIV